MPDYDKSRNARLFCPMTGAAMASATTWKNRNVKKLMHHFNVPQSSLLIFLQTSKIRCTNLDEKHRKIIYIMYQSELF